MLLKDSGLSGKNAPGAMDAFKAHGAGLVVAEPLTHLVAGRNGLTKAALLDEALDGEVDTPFAKDPQTIALQAAGHRRSDT